MRSHKKGLFCKNKEKNTYNKNNIIFKNSSNFDSTVSTCRKCGEDSVDVDINDTFTLSELENKFSDYSFPCKYVHYKLNNQSIIIEME